MLVQFKHHIEGQWFAIAQWALIGVLCLALAKLVWTVVTPVGPLGALVPATATVADTAVVGRFDPFFRSAAIAEPSGNVSTRALVLLGTRVDAVSGRGSAIIATADGRQSSFSVGEEIESGVRLQAVAFDNVTLTANGGTEQLFLDQSSGETPVTPGDAAPMAPLADPATVTGDSIGFEPRLRDGRIDGFTLSPRGTGSAFRAAGLQAGDVLIAVDGTPAATLGDPATVARRLASGRAAVTIERAGKPVTIRIGGA